MSNQFDSSQLNLTPKDLLEISKQAEQIARKIIEDHKLDESQTKDDILKPNG